MTKPTKKAVRRMKVWAVVCSLSTTEVSAYTLKSAARFKKGELDVEFSRCCTHTIIPATLTYSLPRLTKRK